MPIESPVPPGSVQADDKPRDSELDLFGLTHVGKVRKANQDHYLLCTVHPHVMVRSTSLPAAESLPLLGERMATVMLVADGVGGNAGGAEASQLAVEAITSYVSKTLRCYHAAGTTDEGEFEEALRTAANAAHHAVREAAAAQVEPTKGATTMTLTFVIWPWVYVVQVGDSRCYKYLNGELRQITRDQTMAQALVDQGALPADKMAQSPFSHVLTSAIGGEESTPVVSRFEIHDRDSVVFLCSDGLTKHVTNDEIADYLGRMTGSQQVCEALLELALERGGSDNITILAGHAPGPR
ncbi:MAG: protein phosphatase 2C domain-containing protein [Gemmatimonadales bacterium]